MQLLLKSLSLFTIAVGVASIVLFIIGVTAVFQRSLDIIDTFILLFLWIPNILLITILIVLLVKKIYPSNVITSFGLVIAIILSLFLSFQLIQNVNTNGWITENVTNDSMKLTDDGNYEYHLEIINLFQRNSYARLYVKDTSSGDERRIKTEIKTRKIEFLMINKDMVWATLDSTDVEGVYYLTTTNDLKIPEERYEVVIGKGVAYKIN